MSKRQCIVAFAVAMLCQVTLGFRWLGFMVGIAVGFSTAWALDEVINADYRLRPWARRLLRR